ncbi:MAG TPA: phytanoyl-CoA dioxygenase family protein [Abditibacteriaceae bacterium]|nr:phytanoyl-CoA dioxygenase family protein [Abditibacteriaceae bacterium]
MILTQEQLDFFSENGYLPYGKILNDDEVETLRAEYDRTFEDAFASGGFNNLSVKAGTDLQDRQTAPSQMLQIMQMCERNLHFRRLLYETRIRDIVQVLSGPNSRLFHDQALFKPARTGGPITWHQDNAYWKCAPANLVSCWLTLDDVVRENGAMQVLPGSHRKPVWHDVTDTSILLDSEKYIDTSQAVVVDLPAGGCMFHHCQTLHSTEPNNTERQRRAYAIHFMPPGTSRLDQMLPVGFSHPMLRMRM